MASMLQALLTKKPSVPQFKPVDFGALESEAAADWTKLLPQIQPLAEKFNQMSIEDMNKALEQATPGFGAIRDQGTQNILALERGQLPPDVQAQLERTAAERGVALGTSGAQFSEFDAVRNLGLTSLQLSQSGLSAAQSWMAQAAARTPTFNYGSLFINPTQRVGIREAEAQFQWQRDWLSNKIKAIPSGWRAALITLANNVEQIGRSVLSSYAGGMVGGGGGMGGGGGGGAAAGWASEAGNAGFSINPNPGSGGGYSQSFFQEGPQ